MFRETLPDNSYPRAACLSDSDFDRACERVVDAFQCGRGETKVGDFVVIEVTQDVKPDGQILLRKGSHVTGQITQANPFSKGVDNAKMEIVFDKVISKSGEQIPTHLAINALAAKREQTSDDIQDGRGLAASSTRAGVAGGMLSAPASLKPDSKGLFRLDAMRLVPMAKADPPTSLVSSQSRDVHLEKGTEIVLVLVGP